MFFNGENVGRYGSDFAVTKGLLKEFREEPIMDVTRSVSDFVGEVLGRP